MARMNDHLDRLLRWEQPRALKRSYELRAGDAVLGDLTWTKTFGTLAEGTVDGTTFTFKRSGFLHPYVTVRKVPFEEDVARLQLSFNGSGALETNEGKRYLLQKLSFWKNEWGMQDESGNLLMTVKVPTRLRRVGEVEVSESGRGDPHLPMLALLLWYVVAQALDEMAAAAAGGA